MFPRADCVAPSDNYSFSADLRDHRPFIERWDGPSATSACMAYKGFLVFKSSPLQIDFACAGLGFGGRGDTELGREGYFD